MTATLTRPVKKATLLVPIEEDPTIAKQTRQRQDLTAQLEAAKAAQSRLTTERTRLQQERHAAEVSRLLGDAGPDPQMVAERLTGLETELAQVAARLRPLQDAIARLDVIAKETRERVQAERTAQVRSATQALVSEQAALLKHVETLNAEIVALHAAAGADAPMPSRLVREMLERWRPEAAATGADV